MGQCFSCLKRKNRKSRISHAKPHISSMGERNGQFQGVVNTVIRMDKVQIGDDTKIKKQSDLLESVGKSNAPLHEMNDHLGSGNKRRLKQQFIEPFQYAAIHDSKAIETIEHKKTAKLIKEVSSIPESGETVNNIGRLNSLVEEQPSSLDNKEVVLPEKPKQQQKESKETVPSVDL